MQKDITIAFIISLISPIVVLWLGDFLYVGLWYYLLLPSIIIVISFMLKTKAYICTGMCFSLQLSFAGFFIGNIK